jgi:hypothetical protein
MWGNSIILEIEIPITRNYRSVGTFIRAGTKFGVVIFLARTRKRSGFVVRIVVRKIRSPIWNKSWAFVGLL